MPINRSASSADLAAVGAAPAGSEGQANQVKSGSKRVVALNFRVSGEFKKAFKITAATLGVTQSDLLQQVFDEWRQRRE
jgi:hypothetical protein